MMNARVMRYGLLAGLLLSGAAPAFGGPDDFTTGPLIEAYGPTAQVDISSAVPDGAVFNIAFDVAQGAAPGELNRTLVAAARFLNMHVASGIPAENIRLAVVVHGRAVHDVSGPGVYSRDNGDTENANAGLIEALLQHGVEIVVCGQSAVYYDVDREDLLPGVQMALSAMTAHALLQQDGYTLNPF